MFTRDAKYVELLDAFYLNLVKLRSQSSKFSMPKATKSNDVTVKNLKQNADIFYNYI